MLALLLLQLVVSANAFPLPVQTVHIGSFDYYISYSPNTLGQTNYPIDDGIGHRQIVLPNMEGQIAVSWEHEKLHACMHDHPHHYASKEALRAHLEQELYKEEELVTLLAPCMLEANKVELRHNDVGK